MGNTIAIIGTGYVGLVTGACLAEFGNEVICADVDTAKIAMLEKGEIPIFEPGLPELVRKNRAENRLSFTTDIPQAVRESLVIFIAVGTPPDEDGGADLSHVCTAAKQIAQHMDGYRVIVNKSTVPVGTADAVASIVRETLAERGAHFEFDVVSNPEFLREGSAVNDFMHPDRLVIGTASEKAGELMRGVYRALYLNNHPFLLTAPKTAELLKYASNAFLAVKIGFINEMARLCDAVGADVQTIAKGMGMDGRIGKYFLHAGPGFGGSCFPKDTRALAKAGADNSTPMLITEAVIESNKLQHDYAARKVLETLQEVKGKRIAALGLAFKGGTDDVRESPSVAIVKALVRQGASVCAYDPEAMESARRFAFLDGEIEYAESAYDAASDAAAVMILTEWNEFRSMNLQRLANTMRGIHFFDFRNIYERKTVEDANLVYIGMGN